MRSTLRRRTPNRTRRVKLATQELAPKLSEYLGQQVVVDNKPGAGTRKKLLEQGANPVGNTPEQFSRIVQEELVCWAEVVKVSGATAN